MSSEVEAIDWEAVAKALGVPLSTLPVVKSRSLKAETTANAAPDVGQAVRPRQIAGDYALTDAEWVIVEPLIPRGPGAGGKRDRLFINACLYRQRTLGSGREWASAPEAREIPLKSLQGRFTAGLIATFSKS